MQFIMILSELLYNDLDIGTILDQVPIHVFKTTVKDVIAKLCFEEDELVLLW
jgi:hypothetical protein